MTGRSLAAVGEENAVSWRVKLATFSLFCCWLADLGENLLSVIGFALRRRRERERIRDLIRG